MGQSRGLLTVSSVVGGGSGTRLSRSACPCIHTRTENSEQPPGVASQRPTNMAGVGVNAQNGSTTNPFRRSMAVKRQSDEYDYDEAYLGTAA